MSMESELYDASKAGLSMTGYALLQWGFRPDGFPTHSVQLPESVIDHVLAMRDECEHRSHAQAEIERLTAENERMGRQLKRIKAVVPEGLTVMADELQRVRDANQAQEEHDNELPGALALALHVREGKWPHTMDAQVWAEKWLETLAEHPDIATDEGAVTGWFANAIMAGADQAQGEE